MGGGARHSAVICALANFGVFYNYQAINVALLFMDADCDEMECPAPKYPRTSLEDSLLKATVFIGSILGMFAFGYAGDVLGRSRAMLLSNIFSVLGALCSAVLTWGPPHTLYGLLMLWRFLLGVGVGGKFPLGATIRSESTDENAEHTSTEVAKVWNWTIPGVIAPNIVGMVLSAAYGQTGEKEDTSNSASVQFRVVLGLGAVPAILSLFIMAVAESEGESEAFIVTTKLRVKKGVAVCSLVREHPILWKKLVGTGISWFLYDTFVFGTMYSQSSILSDVFESNAIFDTMWQNLLIFIFAGIGSLLGTIALKPLGTKKLQSYGFATVVLSSIFVVLTIQFGNSPWLNFCFFSLAVMAAWGGINVSTYVLPTETFPIEVRSTFSGLSAALGKLGATVGIFIYIPIENALGNAWLFGINAMVAIVGIGVTHWFVEPFGSNTFFSAVQQRPLAVDDDGNVPIDERSLLLSRKQILGIFRTEDSLSGASDPLLKPPSQFVDEGA